MSHAGRADRLAERIGGVVDEGLLGQALVHRSYSYEHGQIPTNERLEFLGDAVLGVVVTEALYRRFPDLADGQLAKLRAAVVNANALADVARDLALGDFLLLGRGEEASGGRDKSSILADAVEAVIGAVYLDRGMPDAAALVHRLFDGVIDRAAMLGAALDWKTSLQELAARMELGVPEYAVDDSGPDHAKNFLARVMIGGTAYSEGAGRSKKEAEQQAAARAFTELERQSSDG